MSRTEILKILKTFKKEHACQYGILLLDVFGSVARGEAKESSDVDVSIDLDNKPKFHANIIGWPDGKDMQKAYAAELASVAELQIR